MINKAEKFLTDIGWSYRDTESSAKLVAEEAQKLIDHLNQELNSTHATLSEMLLTSHSQLAEKDTEIERLRGALARQVGDTRICPKCGEAFLPNDITQQEGVKLLEESK